MLYRKMPKNSDELSILGFGCMRLPLKEEQIDEERATRQIRSAIDAGVNYVDTAWPYHSGQSEPFLGRALSDGYRDKVNIATKLPSWLVDSREDMETYLNAQLDKLQTTQIDYYLIHALNGLWWDKLEKLGVMEFLDQAKAQGRIRNAGFSFHGVLDDFKRIVDAFPWEFCQIQYNYLDEDNQAGTAGLTYAATNALGIIIMEPLRGGNLGLPALPPSVDALWKTAVQQRPPAEWALRWVWDHPEVTVVLSGMNDEAHIQENLAVANRAYPLSLSEKERQLVAAVAREYRKIMKVACTGCAYCKPCPSGVDIPNCFELFNNFHMFGKVDETKMMYAFRMSGLVTGEPGFASQCVQCSECLEKCPQQLEIPDFLEQVVETLEGTDLEKRVAMARQYFKAEKNPISEEYE